MTTGCLGRKGAAIILGVQWGGWTKKRATMLRRIVAFFAGWGMGFTIPRITSVVTVDTTWGAHEDGTGADTPGPLVAIMRCFLK